MNDDQLTTLLAQRARGADDVHPSMAGVESVVARRAQRRRRHRVVGSATGVVIVLACVAGAVALARTGGEGSAPLLQDPAGEPLEVPIVGTPMDGWGLKGVDADVSAEQLLDWDIDTVVFSPAGAGDILPFIKVDVIVIGPMTDYFLPEREVPLEAGVVGYFDDRDDGVRSLTWFEDIDELGNPGRMVYASAIGLTGQELFAFGRQASASRVDTETLAAPPGLPDATRGHIWDDDATFTRAQYVSGNSTLTIEATDQPGWIEAEMESTSHEYSLDSTVPVGPNPFGSGEANLSELDAPGPTMTLPGIDGPVQEAYWRTADGLAIRLTAEGAGAEGVVREILETGSLIPLDEDGDAVTAPVVEPPTTTTATATTVPAGPTTTAIAPGTDTVTLSDVYITTSVTDIELLLTFDAPVPRHGEVFVGDIAGLDCAAGLDEDVDGVSPDSPWVWVSLGAGLDPLGDHVTRTSSDDPYLVCNNGVGSAWLAVPVSSDPGSTVTSTDEGNQLRITVTFPP